MSIRNDRKEANSKLIACLDKYQHVVIQGFKSKGDVYEVDLVTSFPPVEFEQIMAQVEDEQ